MVNSFVINIYVYKHYDGSPVTSLIGFKRNIGDSPKNLLKIYISRGASPDLFFKGSTHSGDLEVDNA